MSEGNVGELIQLAIEHGQPLIEQELREWHTGCGIGAAGSTGAPNGGFNRNNAKR